MWLIAEIFANVVVIVGEKEDSKESRSRSRYRLPKLRLKDDGVQFRKRNLAPHQGSLPSPGPMLAGICHLSIKVMKA